MSRISMDRLVLLATLWTGIFCNYVCYSIIAPFFPQLARAKGLTTEEYSMVFGIYSIAQVLFSCLTGKFISKIGPKFIIVAGLFITGGATILFGCLESSPGGYIFFCLSSSIRAAEGAGFAAYLTSVLTVVVETFPSNPGYYVGLTESVVTVGMIAGPPLGSLLYVAGGYITPFAVFGILIVLTAIVSVFSVSGREVSDTNSPGSLKFKDIIKALKLRETTLAIMCVCLNVVADTYILITLTSHLQQFNLNQMQIGGIYLCLFLSYGLSSPLSGWLADKIDSEFLLQSVGSSILAVSFILVGPASFIPLKCEVWLIIVALLLKGIGAGPLISCSYSSCLKGAKLYAGMPDDFHTYSLVSSIVSFSIPLGNLLGSFTAGVLYDRLGMRLATFLYAGIFIALALVCLIMHLHGRKQLNPFELTESVPVCMCNTRSNCVSYGSHKNVGDTGGILLTSLSSPAIL